MTIDLEWLAAIITAITAIVTPVVVCVKSVNKLVERIENLESWNKRQQRDLDRTAQENEVIITGVLASLKGLREMGCNGPVSQGIEDIEDFLSDAAHRNVSYRKGDK